jgi:hypothetical protein
VGARQPWDGSHVEARLGIELDVRREHVAHLHEA